MVLPDRPPGHFESVWFEEGENIRVADAFVERPFEVFNERSRQEDVVREDGTD